MLNASFFICGVRGFDMKKLIFAFLLFPLSVQAMCLSFYYDQKGQSIATRCGSHEEEVKCEKQDAYWDGKVCREIELIKNCKAQGGTWRQVGFKNVNLSVFDVLDNPNKAGSQKFRNVCICEEPLIWNGEACVSALPPELQNNLVAVWCDSLRKEMNIYIPDEILKP
jgi:hypothetical protein